MRKIKGLLAGLLALSFLMAAIPTVWAENHEPKPEQTEKPAGEQKPEEEKK